ncbi:hypothetical protein Sjap_024312 [Stephania japonica]|uniref:Malectin-like domain-containing protein n=1 Tax=Stephania japonica TaxID=461633 RepID=A0AAP0ED63_9MAGN
MTHSPDVRPSGESTPKFLVGDDPTVAGNVFYRIDCGGRDTFTAAADNQTWYSDQYYTGGAPGLVSEPRRFPLKQEQTLRFFPVSSGKKNCYLLPVPAGRYHLRTFTVYDNYDGKLHPPSFDVAVEGTVVFPWRSPWPDDVAKGGAYSDLFAFVADGEADLCFYSIATDPPVIGSIEIFQVDPLSYDSPTTGDLILVNYGRLSCGSESFGLGGGLVDRFGRAWQSDRGFRVSSKGVKALSSGRRVYGTDQRPNYFPEKLYQEAVTVLGGGDLEYRLTVDAKLDYLVWFHFVEIDVSVNSAGKRVFDVLINEVNVRRIDVFKEVGRFSALHWHYTVKNLNTTVLSVKLVPVVGTPIISGLENYALVPRDLATVPDQVKAMRALKESLKIPGRMGWNGDPCAPSAWDAWEGITCRPNKGKSALVVSQMDVCNEHSLKFLNFVSKASVGMSVVDIPSGTCSLSESSFLFMVSSKAALTRDIFHWGVFCIANVTILMELKFEFFGTYFTLRLLNGNKLEGRVPEELYSIGVHGGAIEVFCNVEKEANQVGKNLSLTGNKGLCGVPSLPACPLFWGKDGLSIGGKIAIGLVSSVVLIILLLVAAFPCNPGDVTES